jgi:hypothetical protein
MDEYIRVINQIKPKNDLTFPVADVNDLKGGYIQVNTTSEMNAFDSRKLKEGMLCYVKEATDDTHMYQYTSSSWSVWSGGSGSGGMTIKTVATLADLNDDNLKTIGRIVYVTEVDSLRWYNGTLWESFTRIYIQSVAPTDTGGIWIDTTDNAFTNSNTVVQQLLQVISVLQEKIKKIEYAFDCEMDFGDFTNNKYYEYNGSTTEEPTYGTSTTDDTTTQSTLSETSAEDATEPTEYNSILPNCRHLKIKSGTYAQMTAKADDFLAAELLWCYDKQQLWIKDPKTLKLVQIGSSSGGGGTTDDDTVDGIITSLINSKTRITGIEFADMNNTNNIYLVQVKDGKLDVHNEALDTKSLLDSAQTAGTTSGYYSTLYFPLADSGSTTSPRIYINMIYCGGDSDKYSYNPVSHNFIELCNLSTKDLNLKGMYLHYSERNSSSWVTLPLYGTIKAGSTFLIRGAQCSVEDVNTTLIKVGTPDMYWTKANTTTISQSALEVAADTAAGTAAHSVWDSDGYLKMENVCSLYLSGSDTTDTYNYASTLLTTSAPYLASEYGVLKYYIDLVGVGTYSVTGVAQPSEVLPFATYGNNILLVRYYTMDPVSQATKAISARKNSTDWTYINLNNISSEINIQQYTPKASADGKDIFFNKHLITSEGPVVVTCNFGYNAHTTRCFTWMSKGYYDEYIMFTETSGDYSSATEYESFKAEDLSSGSSTNTNRPNTNNWNSSIYNRIRSMTTDGVAFTVHKFMKVFDEPTTTKTYYYKVGRDGYWSEERSFTLRNRDTVIANGYNFVQVTDQQGFNQEEYKTWGLCSDYIKANETYDFCINTGDATQNGNRINEWIDYFNNGDSMFKSVEQMYTVGNNDLCPVNVYELGDGSDLAKSNSINVQYFFTFEYPNGIPESANGTYVASTYTFIYGNTLFMCMNSEITSITESDIYLDTDANVYTGALKTWATNEITAASTDSKITWKVAFCHEAPFTIMTEDLIMSYLPTSSNYTPTSTARGGSHLNTIGDYWFSQFLQDNAFKLCICGHKHTYANSRLLHDNYGTSMKPTVYDTSATPSWYSALSDRNKLLCTVSTDTSVAYVKYVMCQATGYKLISNTELPAPNIPWLEEYYPATISNVNNTTNTATSKVNAAQQFPHYIMWNIGTGNETETGTQDTSRTRILGKTYKIVKSATPTTSWYYKYNTPITLAQLTKVGGNGASNASNNIIVEHSL